MSEPRPVCQRCQSIIIDGWPVVMVMSRPDARARVVPLCPVCADAVEDLVRPDAGPLNLPTLEMVNHV